MSDATVDLKALATQKAKAHLQDFLDSNSRLNLPRPSAPRLSILLVLYNRAELTLGCLQSMQPKLAELAAEVVLVDNASRDATPLLLERIRGATVIRNNDNRGFPRAVNQAAKAAAGSFLLLLNNDTEVLDDSLGTALRFLESNPDIGAVGGRVILLDGTLQEAGCTIWREGHVFQYGRGENPNAPEYRFQRDVDYCSAAFLMTRRPLFAHMGGLDEAFSPGYFEDLDYCVRLWRAGWRIVYVPEIAIRHYENASSTCPRDLFDLYRRNHLYFTHKHTDWLGWQSPSGTPPWWVRSSHDDRFHVLYLPRRKSISAAREIRGVVQRLRSRSCFVTVYPIDVDGTVPQGEMPTLPPDVEVLAGGSLETLPQLLAARRDYYDGVVASDRVIVERLKECVRSASRAA